MQDSGSTGTTPLEHATCSSDVDESRSVSGTVLADRYRILSLVGSVCNYVS